MSAWKMYLKNRTTKTVLLKSDDSHLQKAVSFASMKAL